LYIDGSGAGTPVLTVGPSVGIGLGSATIGGNYFTSAPTKLINNGTIQSTSGTVSLATTSADNDSILNNGTINANSGTLILSANITNGPNGRLTAGSGTIVVNGVRITGGTLSGTSFVRFSNDTRNILSGVTLDSPFGVGVGGITRIMNGVTLNSS